METIKNFYRRAFAPTSIASLVYFRILFGLVMLWEVTRYFNYRWIPKYYIKPKFLFTYYGFEWVKPLAGNGMYYVWGAIGVLSVLIAIGLFYRISIILFFFLFSYIFLLAKSHYLNHFYFVILVSFIMMFLSPHKFLSVDAKIGIVKKDFSTVSWQLWLLRFQMGVVYFFGGIAKLDPDWMAGVPLNRWLDKHISVPMLGKLLAHDTTALILSWSGLLLDLFIVPLLLFKRTRLLGFLILFAFHVSNHFLFKIGIFPWFSLGISLLYFSSDFPVKIYERLSKTKIKWPMPKEVLIAALDRKQVITASLVTLFVSYNLLMPLRHHLYKGDVHWSELGHAYSWRMKLRNKSAKMPIFYFRDLDSGEQWNEKASKRLNKRQWRNMGGNPEMILSYALYLKKVFEEKGHKNLRIRVKAKASVNFRPIQRIIVQGHDLANERDCIFCNPKWINPLTKENQRGFGKSLH